jgi:hypothetical protein
MRRDQNGSITRRSSTESPSRLYRCWVMALFWSLWAVSLGRQVLAYYLLGALVCFLIPFPLVEGIAWVVRGFQR